MRHAIHVKSISDLKANAAAMLHTLADAREPVLSTLNGKAKAVLQDLAAYEALQAALALLKLLGLGQHDVDAVRVASVAEAFDPWACVRDVRISVCEAVWLNLS